MFIVETYQKFSAVFFWRDVFSQRECFFRVLNFESSFFVVAQSLSVFSRDSRGSRIMVKKMKRALGPRSLEAFRVGVPRFSSPKPSSHRWRNSCNAGTDSFAARMGYYGPQVLRHDVGKGKSGFLVQFPKFPTRSVNSRSIRTGCCLKRWVAILLGRACSHRSTSSWPQSRSRCSTQH